MFAARICSRVACQTSLREIEVRRGSTPRSGPIAGSSPTQSPTPGRSSARTRWLAALARSSPSSPSEVVCAPVLDRDAGGVEPGGAVLGERGLQAVVPPEPVKHRFRDRKCQPMLLCVSSEGRQDPPGHASGDEATGRGAASPGRNGLSHRCTTSSSFSELRVLCGQLRLFASTASLDWPRPRRGEVPNRVRSGRKQP